MIYLHFLSAFLFFYYSALLCFCDLRVSQYKKLFLLRRWYLGGIETVSRRYRDGVGAAFGRHWGGGIGLASVRYLGGIEVVLRSYVALY